jgi:hypothetical protein
MSDNRRRYRAIKTAFVQLCPEQSRGTTVLHLRALAALINGIVDSKGTNLPAVAGKVSDRTKRESRVKRSPTGSRTSDWMPCFTSCSMPMHCWKAWRQIAHCSWLWMTVSKDGSVWP